MFGLWKCFYKTFNGFGVEERWNCVFFTVVGLDGGIYKHLKGSVCVRPLSYTFFASNLKVKDGTTALLFISYIQRENQGYNDKLCFIYWTIDLL